MNITAHRLDCSVCHYHHDLEDESSLTTLPSNVRAFMNETFKFWRCPTCKTIHCLDVVDLDLYYAKYPIVDAKFREVVHTVFYRRILKQLEQSGFSKHHSFLDYGCANGLFLEFLSRQGFTNCYGYDPYGAKEGFGNPAPLARGEFDYILLQDVVEHVEDPHELFSKLNSLLAPGGHILIGTPNAANINLSQASRKSYQHEIHAPYHLHIYTRPGLEVLGQAQGWEPVHFFDRSYSDTHYIGLNTRAWVEYSNLSDGSFDSLMEPITLQHAIKALSSAKFLFYALFGYWFSLKSHMAITFRKSNY